MGVGLSLQKRVDALHAALVACFHMLDSTWCVPLVFLHETLLEHLSLRQACSMLRDQTSKGHPLGMSHGRLKPQNGAILPTCFARGLELD